MRNVNEACLTTTSIKSGHRSKVKVVLALQETHHKTSEVQNITTTDGNTHYTIYHSENDQEPRAGVAIITNQSAHVSFLAVSARLCMCTETSQTKDIYDMCLCSHSAQLREKP